MMYQKECGWCKKPFVSKYKKPVYCSSSCAGYKNMGKYGVKWVKAEPEEIIMNSSIAYLVGLIATDGTLRKKRKQFKMVSKDEIIIQNTREIACNYITGRWQNYSLLETTFQKKKFPYFQLQFTSPIFYDFCVKIGLSPNKTHVLDRIEIPDEFFFSFLRGVIDGDGNYNPQRNVCRIRIYSGSRSFLDFLNEKCKKMLPLKNGGLVRVSENELGSKYILTFNTTSECALILNYMYRDALYYLPRKKQQIEYLLQG